MTMPPWTRPSTSPRRSVALRGAGGDRHGQGAPTVVTGGCRRPLGVLVVLLAADPSPRGAGRQNGAVGVEIPAVGAGDPVVDRHGHPGVPRRAVHEDVFHLHLDAEAHVAAQEGLDLVAAPLGGEGPPPRLRGPVLARPGVVAGERELGVGTEQGQARSVAALVQSLDGAPDGETDGCLVHEASR